MRRIVMAGTLFTLAAAALVTSAQEPREKPVLERKGRYVYQWKDDRIQVAVGTRYVSARMDSPWMMLQLYLSGVGQRKPVRIDREDITLVAPGGTTINLASQKALMEGIPDVRKMYLESSVNQDPLEGYFVGQTDQQRLGFFAPPTEKVTYDQVTVDYHILAGGYLFFRAPGDKWPAGRYTLQIYNKDVDLRIPFTLPAPNDYGKDRSKAKDDKSVPW